MDKSEIEKQLNTLLGTKVKWSKLSKEECEEILKLVQNPRELMVRLTTEFAKLKADVRISQLAGKVGDGKLVGTILDRLSKRVDKAIDGIVEQVKEE